MGKKDRLRAANRQRLEKFMEENPLLVYDLRDPEKYDPEYDGRLTFCNFFFVIMIQFLVWFEDDEKYSLFVSLMLIISIFLLELIILCQIQNLFRIKFRFHLGLLIFYLTEMVCFFIFFIYRFAFMPGLTRDFINKTLDGVFKYV